MSTLNSILPFLVCPVTKQLLSAAPTDLVTEVNNRIANKAAIDGTATTIEEKLDSGLLRADGKIMYPIRGGIPSLLPGSGITV